MVDIRDPANPSFAGCYAEDGYTHDAECVIYSGPDERYSGHEICFNYNEDTLTIVDVTHKDEIRLLSRCVEICEYVLIRLMEQSTLHIRTLS